MAENSASESPKGPTAPYTSFLTVKNIVKDMKEHGVPTRIDRSVFPNLAGGTVGQILPAMKFLTLTDEAGHPTPRMTALVAAYGTDTWPSSLADIVRSAYGPLFQINLEAASPGQFLELFRKTYPGAEDVSRKSQTFFLNAARDAGIKISPYIMKNKKPRSTPAKRRAPKQNGAAGVTAKEPTATETATAKAAAEAAALAAKNAAKKPSEVLLGLFNKDMKREEQDAIWLLIKFFKAKDQ
ncbi:MAG TPA: DUF5343 domain-containing protein [Stellaceae bacterium]|jgi:hypothetical protein